MSQKLLVQALIASGIFVAGLGTFAIIAPNHAQAGISANMSSANGGQASAITGKTLSSAAVALPNFSSIVAQNGPAVVNISVTQKTGKPDLNFNPHEVPDFGPDNPFSQYFHPDRAPRPERNTPMRGMGSGFIVSPDGIVLTNAHVVDGAAEVNVKLTDKREFKAKVLGSDRASDIAVLKIDAKDLPTVKLATDDDVTVGEWVLAIGSPFGFENSASAGIVSAKSRALPGSNYTPFLQTDVAINPGNSGGPLFNMKGEVIGINSQIYSRSGSYEGLSFAVPMSVVLGVKAQLIEHGTVRRSRIGVAIQNVNAALADSFGLKRAAGALVSSVEEDSPAAKAGIKEGDVIVKYNGNDILNSSDLPLLVSNTPTNTVVKVDILRNGEARTMQVMVAELQNDQVAANEAGAGQRGKLGVVVRKLNADEQKESGLHGGVLVENASGPAASAGIQQGDVILSISGTPVNSGEQLKTIVDKSSKRVALLIQREGQKLFVPVDLG